MSAENLGQPVLAIHHSTLARAVSRCIEAIGVTRAEKLKPGSGEHLAAILATAFLDVPPYGVDLDGGPDLVFDVTRNVLDQQRYLSLLGSDAIQFVDFETKSLPRSDFRKFNAAIDRDIAAVALHKMTSSRSSL